MPKKAKYALLLLAGLLALAISLCWLRSYYAWSTGIFRWGQAQLQVSERAYYLDRINAVGDTWLDIVIHAKPDEHGRIADLPFSCLVVDTAARRVWIERYGQVLPDSEAQLPPQVEWKLYRVTPKGTTELASPSRFWVPGFDSARLQPEAIFLVGACSPQGYLRFEVGRKGGLFGVYADGPWNPGINWDSRKQTPGEDLYESVVVNDRDYEQVKAKFGASDLIPAEPAALREAKAAYRRMERALYQEIERQISLRGLQLVRLKVTNRPDYTAASAELFAAHLGWRHIFRRGPSVDACLQIDYLGNDVWYASSAPPPRESIPGLYLSDLEFLVSAQNPIPRKNRQNLLVEGRRRQ